MWKRSPKQTLRSSGEKIGCMNGIFKMFYVFPSRKMLSDGSRKRWYRRNKNKPKLLTNVERDGPSEEGREKVDAANVNRRNEEGVSRKILDARSKVVSGLGTDSNVDSKQKKRNKNSGVNTQNVAANDVNVAASLQSHLLQQDEEFSDYTNADDLLERLYNNRRKGLYSQPSEESSTSEMLGNPYDDPVLKKTLDEVLENIIGGKISDPTTKALETLKSNKDLLLKVLQDPKIINILIVNNSESCQQSVVTGKQHRADSSVQWEEPGRRKSRGKQKMKSFLEDASEDSTPPKESDNSQGLRRIVILKPNQLRKQISSDIMDLTSPSQSSYSSSSNMETERGPFHYITKEIKKFKRVISVSHKRRHVLSTDDIQYGAPSSESQVSEDIADVSEYLKADDSMCSSSIEQASQSSENTNKSRESQLCIEPELGSHINLSKNWKVPCFPQHLIAPGVGRGKSEESMSPTQETDSDPFGPSWMNLKILNCNGDNSNFEPQILDSSSKCLDIHTAQDNVSSGKTLSAKDFETTAISENDMKKEHFDVAEICKNDRPSTCSTLDFSEDQPQPESLLISSTTAVGIHNIDASESPKKPERPNSASVLESLLLDKVIRHGSIKTERDAADVFRLPLRKMVFEERNDLELNVARSDSEPSLELCVSDADFKFDYMRALLEASGLCQRESKSRDHDSTRLLDSSLYDEVETPSGEIPDDLKILFDCITEVIEVIHERSANFMPWVSFINPKFRPFPYGEKLIEVTWRGLNHSFVPWFPVTLEQNVKKDMDTGTWMDIRNGVDDIGITVGDEILDNILEETVLDLWD